MYITNRTNYALRILMYCGLHHPERSTIPRIAAAYRISAGHLASLLPVLTGLGVLAAFRGRKGGIALARDPGDISIGSVVRATEDQFLLAECFRQDQVDCPLVDACKLQSIWSEALEAFLTVLDNKTLADLVANRGELQMRLGIEAPPIRGFRDQPQAAVASGAPSPT